jgi:phosphoglycolate phosphatase-like HAD superfamily hydrolase
MTVNDEWMGRSAKRATRPKVAALLGEERDNLRLATRYAASFCGGDHLAEQDMPTRAIIFDIDGTLVDSNDAHAKAWLETLEEDGLAVSFDAVRRAIGMGSDKLLPAVVKIDAESDRGKRLAARSGALFKQKFLPSVRPFPQTRELFEKLTSMGLRVGIATSARGDELERLLEVARVRDLVDEHTTSDDVDASKPEPDVVQVALNKLRCRPEQAIMVGDTPYDIQAAAAAGVASIGFRCGGWRDGDLRGASAIYDGAAEMLERFNPAEFDRARQATPTR